MMCLARLDGGEIFRLGGQASPGHQQQTNIFFNEGLYQPHSYHVPTLIYLLDLIRRSDSKNKPQRPSDLPFLVSVALRHI